MCYRTRFDVISFGDGYYFSVNRQQFYFFDKSENMIVISKRYNEEMNLYYFDKRI